MATTHQVPFKDHEPITVIVDEGVHGFKDDSGKHPWEHYRYAIAIMYQGRLMNTSYSQGMSWAPNEVDPQDVLASLVNDYDSGRWESFEGWAEDYGYDPDSRRAERIYLALEENRRHMDAIFGADIEDLLHDFDENRDED